jgi:hypothetical protein
VGLEGIFHDKYSDLDASVFMKPKEVEMDGILERITKEGDRTLMVVCGDHGMNDVGPLLRNI